jgi:TMEM70/TMEM186/TMEM223 protein family
MFTIFPKHHKIQFVKPLVTSWRALHTSPWTNQQSNEVESPPNHRVYYGLLTPNIRSVKVFSLTTSIAGVMAQPILYEQAAKLGSSVSFLFYSIPT